jgi:SAM-dependent methyltransferase
MKYSKLNNSCNCFTNRKNVNLIEIYTYKKRPKNEPDYKIKNYFRKIKKCPICNHFFAEHKINISKLYKKEYSIISTGNNIQKKFDFINSLGKKSDNYYRVKRIISHFSNFKKKIDLLDVGSGISIFLYQVKINTNWNVLGIEPDINYVNFAKKNKINVIHSNFKKNILKKKFNIITLNKVIEHIKNPLNFLTTVKQYLKKNGQIYIEVPDGLSASKSPKGKDQSEFNLDHFHIFSKTSLLKVASLSGLKCIKIKSIKEKSKKFTIYGFFEAQ